MHGRTTGAAFRAVVTQDPHRCPLQGRAGGPVFRNGMAGHSRSAKGIQPREYGLGPLDRTSPDPYLVLVGWSSEPDPDRSLRPGNRMGRHQFLDTVLP